MNRGHWVTAWSESIQGRPGYRLVHCWAHVLRKFRDLVENDSRSVWMLEHIGEAHWLPIAMRRVASVWPG